MAQTTGMTPHVVRILRSRIARGVYTGRLPGERVLATEFGVNPKTIENALTHLKVMGLVRRRSRSGTFAVPETERPGEGAALYVRLAVSSPVDPQGEVGFWTSLMIYGFQRAAQARAISMALEDAESVEEVVEEAIAEAGSPACVGTCILSMPVEARHAIRLAASQGNMVLADWDIEEPVVPCVTFDNLMAGRLAAEHLVKLGHRRITFATEEPVSPSKRDRLRGVEECLRGAGMRLPSQEIYRGEHHTALGRMLSAPEPPTAIITGSPGEAEVFMELAASRGVAVPNRLSLLTFAEPRLSRRRHMTIIATDHESLGRRAFDMLLDEEVHANPQCVRLPVRLVQGDTTAPPRQA